MKITNKKVSSVTAYEAGNVVMKVYLTRAEFKSSGMELKEGKDGALARVTLAAYEWDTWRSDMPESFPRIFGTITFEFDTVEYVKNEDALKDGYYKLVGFVPAGPATGKALLPEFAKLPKAPAKKDTNATATPKGF